MTSTGLERECAIFTRALLGVAPSAYVVDRYVAAHRHRAELTAATARDLALLRVARRGVWWCRLADAFAARFRRTGALRAKLVVLVAILETAPPFYRRIDPAGRSVPVTIVELAGRGVTAIVATVVAVIVVGPIVLLASERP